MSSSAQPDSAGFSRAFYLFAFHLHMTPIAFLLMFWAFWHTFGLATARGACSHTPPPLLLLFLFLVVIFLAVLLTP